MLTDELLFIVLTLHELQCFRDRQLEAFDFDVFLDDLLHLVFDLCEVDDRSEKIGYKIREAQLEKVPYMVVVGDKDIENNTISIRKRKEGDLGAMTVEQFLEKIVPDRDNKVID